MIEIIHDEESILRSCCNYTELQQSIEQYWSEEVSKMPIQVSYEGQKTMIKDVKSYSSFIEINPRFSPQLNEDALKYISVT